MMIRIDKFKLAVSEMVECRNRVEELIKTGREMQSLRSKVAKYEIELDIIKCLIEDPDYELSGSDFEHETKLIYKIYHLVKSQGLYD